MKFIIYNKNTGEILISGETAEIDTIVIKDDEEMMIVDCPIDDIYRNSGKWINLETKEIIDFGEKPNGLYNLTATGWIRNIETEKICASEDARSTRNALLSESDWTDNLSSKNRLGDTLYQKWQDYRQALRDLPQQESFPFSIVWPIKPE